MRHGPAELSHAGLVTRGLAGKVLSAASELAIPMDIAVTDEYLVVIDLAADSVLHVIHRSTGALIGQFGRRGAGPGEFKAAWSMQAVDDDPAKVWIYDIGLRRLTLVDIGASLAASQITIVKSLQLSTDGVPTGPVWIDSATAVSLGFFRRGRIGVFDAAGNHTRTYGSLPLDSLEVTPAVQQHVYQTTAALQPSKRLLAAVTRHASRIEIYAVPGTTVAFTNGPVHIAPRYTMASSARGPFMQTGADLRFGYVDVAAAEGAAFALFSGRTREGFPQRAYLASHVHVFDWTGRFMYVLRLDSDVAAIAVDERASLLYAVRHGPTPAVVCYRLADIGTETLGESAPVNP
ncbi:MAG: hypothetical protein JSW71_04235 [Gemmatimonadota bacterium]|nr:MAG: hypothetical protein JSW71_04235 [Gemmatimonadota bacterium]